MNNFFEKKMIRSRSPYLSLGIGLVTVEFLAATIVFKERLLCSLFLLQAPLGTGVPRRLHKG